MLAPVTQLPGGGTVLFLGRRLVALYGHPGAPSLGVLGEQGGAAQKLATWRAVRAARPHGARLGWKNFFDEDHPTFSPGRTMARHPKPVMVSYQ